MRLDAKILRVPKIGLGGNIEAVALVRDNLLFAVVCDECFRLIKIEQLLSKQSRKQYCNDKNDNADGRCRVIFVHKNKRYVKVGLHNTRLKSLKLY